MDSTVGVMYRVKPLLEFGKEIPLSTVMYPMKNMNCSYSDEAVPQCQDEDNLIKQIEERQAIILKTLHGIRAQMVAMKEQILRRSDKSSPLIGSSCALQQCQLSELGISQEVVINAPAQYPPYSLLAVNRLWKGAVNIKLSSHTHSSVTDLPECAKNFDKLSSLFKNECGTELKVRLVWKDVESCEMVISPVKYLPIHGEVNILRFLQRCISPMTDALAESLTDSKLDLCHLLTCSKNNKEIHECLLELSQALEKSTWLNGNTISIVDIAVWSAVKNFPKLELPKFLRNWFTNCEQSIGVIEMQ